MKNRIVSVLCLLLITCSMSLFGAVSRPTHEGKVLLFGNLHAHSKLSDDISAATDEFLPLMAFQYAQEHGLDFLAISDHHKAVDSPHRLFMTEDEYKTLLYDVAVAHNQTNAEAFIAIPGIEWGNTATGNHINALGVKVLTPDSLLNDSYDSFFTWAKTNADFVQFNHPNSWKAESPRNNQVGNFGQNLYPDSATFVTQAGAIAKTMCILNSVRGGHISGEFRHSTAKTHREIQKDNYDIYRQFLNMGFHLSPAADQDTHWTNWGTVTAARTAVWVDQMNYTELMDGFRTNRVYATEDDELAVVFQIRHQGKTYWMGETVGFEGEEADVEVLVKVWQTAGSDGDSTDEGPYTVTLMLDPDGIGGNRASEFQVVPDVPQGTLRSIPLHVRAGQYVFVQVSEQEGKDSPTGEGADEVVNGTQAEGSDGKRDDMNDTAVTTPIWFTGQPKIYIWSVNSNKYHDSDCWAVASIGAANRRSGSEPPANKSKHDCHP